jgi:hypothetical protein
LVLPSGRGASLNDLPLRNIDLVVIRQDLHLATKYLLLQAMQRVHSKSTMFTKSNEFPAVVSLRQRQSLSRLVDGFQFSEVGSERLAHTNSCSVGLS